MNFTDFLLLVDSRLPAGGHSHSGGIAPAIESGLITSISQLESALRARVIHQGPTLAGAVRLACVGVPPSAIDASLDIRMISKAARNASRSQGKGLTRVASAVWPDVHFERIDHHHPIAFGLIAKHLKAETVAPIAFLQQGLMSGASVGVRLLGFDPLEIASMISNMRLVLEESVQSITHIEEVEQLPSSSLPGLEVLVERYAQAEVRLFAS